MTPVDIQYLVLKAQAGDRQSLSLLCEYMYPRLSRYAFKVCADTELGKEATQDVLLKLSCNLNLLRDPAAFTGWCFRLLRNRCLDLLTSSYQRKTNTLGAEDPCQQEHQEPESEYEKINTYLACLSADDRDTLYFFYVEELSVQEIGHITGVPAGTVKSRLFRARQQIKALLEQSENTSGGKDEKYR